MIPQAAGRSAASPDSSIESGKANRASIGFLRMKVAAIAGSSLSTVHGQLSAGGYRFS
jgi:hypothetical protein